MMARMLRDLKAVVTAMVVTFATGGVERAYAFDGVPRVAGPVALGGSSVCEISVFIEGNGTAFVELENVSIGILGFPSITGWNSGSVISGGSAWTENELANCFDVGTSIATILVDGANGTFATDNYVGIIFRRTDPNGLVFEHELAVTDDSFINTVVAIDITPPVITLLGDDPAQVLLNTSYTDAGATASDAEDGDLTGSIVLGGDVVDTSVVGNYTITYDVMDSSGNAAAQVTRTVNVSAPSDVVLSGGPDVITNTDPFTITAAFSKPVTGFVDLASDVNISNATVTAITGGPSIYALTIQPNGTGDVLISVPASVAQDNVGHPNTVSNTLLIGNRIVEITQEQIAGFMLSRANNLVSNQPRLTRFLMGKDVSELTVDATGHSGSTNGFLSRGSFWAETRSVWSGDGSYTLGSIGAHIFANSTLLFGGMVQFDRTDDPINNASGHGSMVGPYFVTKTPFQPLFLEGRLLYGRTNNKISPLASYTDNFETERWLAQLRASGEYKVQNTKLMPSVDFTYTQDRQHDYTDNLGNTISGQTVNLMQLSTGINFSAPLPVRSGSLELSGGFSGIYSSSEGAAAAPDFESWRGRIPLSLNYNTGRGATVQFGTFYDGIGASYESYGADLSFDLQF